MSEYDNIQLEDLGGPNDFWHVVEKHEDEHGDGGAYFEIVNYARHERIYIHDATEARVQFLRALLNEGGF